MTPNEPLFIGIGGHIVAIDRTTGGEIWRCKLKRMNAFITITTDPTSVYGAVSGELFCVDKTTGNIRWHNKLTGLGTGIIAFSGGATEASVIAGEQQRRAAAAAAAGAGA